MFYIQLWKDPVESTDGHFFFYILVFIIAKHIEKVALHKARISLHNNIRYKKC